MVVDDKAPAEIDDLFDELDSLLETADVGGSLAERGVNVGLPIVAADGLRAYLHGDTERAAEALSTAASRLAVARELAKAMLS